MADSDNQAHAAEPAERPAGEEPPPEDPEEHLLLHAERSSIFETRVERAALCRDRGSAQFKAKNLAGAVAWYERAIFHVDFDEGTWHFEFMDKHRDAVNEVRLPVYLNLAACFLADGKTQDLSKVVENANLALAIDADNTKALYRAGKASLMMGDLDAARAKLTRAAKSQPSDKNIREAMQTLKAKLSEHKQKEKETWGGRLLDDAKTDEDSADDAVGHSTSTASEAGSVISDLRFLMIAVMVVVVAIVAGLANFGG